MKRGQKEKVIRPPMEEIASGRVFRPHPRFKYKMWILVIMAPSFSLFLECWCGYLRHT